MPRYLKLAAAALLIALSCGLPDALVAADTAETAAQAPENAAQAPENPAEAYAAVLAQWNQVTEQLDRLTQEFRSAAPDQRQELRAKYLKLIEQANATLPQLRAAGIAAYQAAPNQDQELAQLLVGIAASDLRSDHPDAALALCELLIENKCAEPHILAVAGAAAYHLDNFDLAEQYLDSARQAGALDEEGQMFLSDVPQAKKLWAVEQQLRRSEAQADDLPRVLLKTSKGDLLLELYENEAPQAVGNFVSLVESGFYDGRTFHRVLPGFMAQGGCPSGDGTGGPGYEIYCECHQDPHRNHFRGTLSMAHAGRDTGGSQFFLTFRRTSHLDGRHTAFGRVIQGLDVLERLQRIDPQGPSAVAPDKILQAQVVRKRDHEYKPVRVQ